MSSCLQPLATETHLWKAWVGGCQELWASWRACLSLPQVAKIHQASKDGQLYDVGGDAKRCSAQAEPPEPTEYDIRPASQVYSVSSALASTPDLGLGKAPLPCALSQGPASGPLLA